MSSSTRHRAKILNVLVCLVLIDKAESPAARNEIQKFQGSFIGGRGPHGDGPGRDAVDEHEARKVFIGGDALLKIPTPVQSGCDLSSAEIERFYDASSAQWRITDEVLEELSNDVQAIVECANDNDTLLFATNQTIKPTRTLIFSHNLTLASQFESGSTENGVPVPVSEKVRMTCPDSGQLILSRSPSFTLRNLVIEDCNTNTSVIQLNPDCTIEGTRRSTRFHGLTIQRNLMLVQGNIINSSNAGCLQLELNGVSIRRNRCVGPCVMLSANNTLNSIALVRNNGSNSNSEDSSIFSSIEGSETLALNVTSENNEIRTFQLTRSIIWIANSHFSDNRRNVSSETRDTSIAGGVLAAIRSFVSISTTTFERNYAFHGGGVGAWSSNVTINQCVFRENEASYGGSLYLSDASSAMTSDSLFSNNKADSEAGAIYLNNSVDLLVHDSRFEGNQAGFRGGCLSLCCFSNASILNCSFTYNTANAGGAISIERNATATLTSSTFKGNEARWNGGAFFIWNLCNASILNCTFTNSISNNGGAVGIEQNSMTILTHSTFIGNQARQYGGALSLRSFCNATILYCTFTNNTSDTDGGAMRLSRNSTTTLIHSAFEGNQACHDAGALSMWNFCNATIINCGFTNNNSTNGGGAILIGRNSRLTLTQSTFKGNQVDKDGGALALWDSCNAAILNCTYTNNTSITSGGAIRVAKNSILTITHSTFKENKARRNGGALTLWDFCNVTILNCNLTNNTAIDDGGAVKLTQDSRTTIAHSTFEGNQALRHGGALCIENRCHAMFLNNSFDRNNASGFGGGVYAIGSSHINASNSNVIQNTVGRMGGGIAVINASSLLCHMCLILNNRALSGAGLYAYSSDSIEIVAQLQNSRFENNSAQSHGGGIEFDAPQNRNINCSSPSVTCGHIILLDTSFIGNYANHSGAIVLTVDPNRVSVDCEDGRRRNHGFLGRTEMKSLDTLDPNQMCSSWRRNNVSSNAHGNVVGTYGREIVLSIGRDEEVRLVGDTTSGYVLENVGGARQLPDITFTTFDMYGVGPAPTSPYAFEARMLSTDGFFRGSYAATISGGSGNFSNVVGFVRPGNYTIAIRSDHPVLERLHVTVVVRECIVGEEPTRGRLSCQWCDAFTYNFNASVVGGCKECPNDATCEGRYIVPKEGYWHNSLCHDQVKECLVNHACKYQNRKEVLTKFTQNFTTCNMSETSKEAYRDDLCNEGYEGPLCGSCKTGFGLTLLFQCLRCPHKAVSFLVIVGVTSYLLAVAAFTIRGCLPFDTKKAQSRTIRVQPNASSRASIQDPEINIEMVRMIVEGHVPPEYFQRMQEEVSTSQMPIDPIGQENQYDLTKWKTTEILKIMINFLQTTAVAASVDVDWTDGMNDLFEASEYIGALAASAIAGPIDCLASSTSKVSRSILRMLLSLFVPTFVMLMFAAFWGFLALKNGEDVSYFGKKTFLSIIAVTYISYLGLTKMAVKAFYCINVYDSVDPFMDSRNQYLATETSIECYKTDHFGLIAIAVIVLVVVTIAFPLISGVLLLQNKERHMKKDSWMFETVGFLFRAFKETCLFWESLVMLRKAFLSLIVVFSYSLGGLPQGILALIVLLTSLYVHLTIRPYRKEFERLNSLESASLLVSCLTFTLGLFFGKSMSSESVKVFLSVVIIAANMLFFICLSSAFFKSGISHLKVVLQYENVQLPDQAPWWRVLKVFITIRCRSLLKLSS